MREEKEDGGVGVVEEGEEQRVGEKERGLGFK